MRVFIDSDVILDCVLDRPGFGEDSTGVLNLCENGKITGLTSSLVLANCHYVFSKHASSTKSRNIITRLRAILKVCSVGDHELGEALVSNFKDLEDGIQFFTAMNNEAEVIVTRNIQDFKPSTIPILTPSELIASLHEKPGN